MDSIELIKDELDTDPIARGYNGMDSDARLTSLNTIVSPPRS